MFKILIMECEESMIWIVLFIILGLDQWSKYFISNTYSYLESVPIIPKIFHLTYVRNYGAAFGILQNRRELFLVITFVVIGIVIYFFKQLPKDWMSKLALGLALGGTIGNLLDRLRFGYVVDFFDFQIWPVFNVADSAIVIGMSLFAIKILLSEKKAGEMEDV